MPGGGNKFVVHHDAETSLYVTLGNPQTEDAFGADQRNVLELLTSPDLIQWCGASSGDTESPHTRDDWCSAQDCLLTGTTFGWYGNCGSAGAV